MNRVIKFRAWDEDNNAMWMSDSNNGQEYCELYFTSSGKKFFKYGVYRPYQANGEVIDNVIEEDFEPSNGHWMQFTGLHDRNGVEIYEGDILQDTLTKMVYEVKFGRCVKYAYNGWFVENKEHNYVTQINGDYDTNSNSQIEVIGNIYEHPQLLNNQ